VFFSGEGVGYDARGGPGAVPVERGEAQPRPPGEGVGQYFLRGVVDGDHRLALVADRDGVGRTEEYVGGAGVALERPILPDESGGPRRDHLDAKVFRQVDQPLLQWPVRIEDRFLEGLVPGRPALEQI